MTELTLTVAICTWNRAQRLRQTLAHLAGHRLPPAVDWELLVVDNNSTDKTPTVLREFAQRVPLRTYLEPVPGKSHALNCAVRHARGAYILWMDDDVQVGDQWVTAYVHAFRTWPDASFFGGPIEPWFEGSPPPWLMRGIQEVGSAFGLLELGSDARPLTERELPYGANMAVRTADQRRFMYDPTKGPRPGSAVRGEETAMLQDMLRHGLSGRWVPEARVRHWVPQDRQTVAAIRKYYEGYGELLARNVDAVNGLHVFGKPAFLWRQMVESSLSYRWHRLRGQPERWLGSLRIAATHRGRWRAYQRSSCVRTPAL